MILMFVLAVRVTIAGLGEEEKRGTRKIVPRFSAQEPGRLLPNSHLSHLRIST